MPSPGFILSTSWTQVFLSNLKTLWMMMENHRLKTVFTSGFTFTLLLFKQYIYCDGPYCILFKFREEGEKTDEGELIC
jgi:hypothetical protein